jgi:NADH-quinone oxidoreductase subunit L
MSDVRSYLWLIPALPLAAAVLTAFLGPKVLRRYSHWPCILATLTSCVLSVLVLTAVAQAPAEDSYRVEAYYPWFQVAVGTPLAVGTPQPVDVGFTLRADALSSIMLVMITFVGTFIAIYSVGYMHGELNGGHGESHEHGGHGSDNWGYPRFFAEVALFIFSMTLLVLADNFIVLYAGWEGVGLCSYLLIGFWFTRPSAANAARKAFLVTRIGDVGLLLGIILLWLTCGHRLDFDGIFAAARGASFDRGLLAAACLLLFCGAVGKSAQFPLHVWLPDAMEGPSPVSALIHAATMVTAGVYLVARCTPLFELAPEAQLVVGGIGGFTALLAALIALTQNDLKRVLAYSTISQLGYMFLGLGSAVAAQGLVTFGVAAAMFHLFTHAFFKALLFLAAGSVMHAMGDVIDMRRFGGLRRVLPVTHGTFLCGALALAGFPLLSGFWSKDEVLATTFGAGHGGEFAVWYQVLFVVGMVTAALTAFYTFRAYFLTFWGETRLPPEAGEHADESPPVMTVPLMVLAVFAVGVGAALGPTDVFAHLLERTPLLPEPGEHHPDYLLMGGSALIALAGIAFAWLEYVRSPSLSASLARNLQALYQLSLNKFHFDELYHAFIVMPLEALAALARVFDQYVIDGLVDLVGQLPRTLGSLFRPVQNGLVQFYALAMILGLTVFLLALVSHL